MTGQPQEAANNSQQLQQVLVGFKRGEDGMEGDVGNLWEETREGKGWWQPRSGRGKSELKPTNEKFRQMKAHSEISKMEALK